MGKTITIDGTTYNNVESVSVNGNLFGEGASEYTEEILRRDFSPNGAAFYDTVSIDFARGDYIEAKVDITNQTPKTVIFAVGDNITKWPDRHNPSTSFAIYTHEQGTNYYRIRAMKSVSSQSTEAGKISVCETKPYGNNVAIFRIDAAGVWFNGTLVKPSEYTANAQGNALEPVRSDLIGMSTVQIGAAQSDTDYSYAYYDYIKVFRKN